MAYLKSFACLERLTGPALMIGLLIFGVGSTAAHPTSFSQLDLRSERARINATLTLHASDLARALSLTEEDLLDAGRLDLQRGSIAGLLAGRLELEADGRALSPLLVDLVPVMDQQTVIISLRYELPAPAGRVGVAAALFPDDPRHQTFITVRRGESVIRQDFLTSERTRSEFFADSPQGIREVIKRFVPAGIHHIFIGPDHILFLIGLLLPGGNLRRLLLIVTTFTAAHSITLTLATLGLLILPGEIIEPAIALSIVHVGIDNLIYREGGRDLRWWSAFFFGLIHGFGFASVLSEFGLPAEALGWSLFSFNLGVEIGQALIVILVAIGLSVVTVRYPRLHRPVIRGGSALIILAGCFWFVARIVSGW